MHPDSETQSRRHQKSKTGIVAPQKGLMSSKFFLEKYNWVKQESCGAYTKYNCVKQESYGV